MVLLRTCVILVLLAPASCANVFFTHPLTCYMLDAFLLAYCVIATMLYLKLRFFSTPCLTAEAPTPLNPDPYQELETLKQKKKDAKTKKPRNTPNKKLQQTSSPPQAIVAP